MEKQKSKKQRSKKRPSTAAQTAPQSDFERVMNTIHHIDPILDLELKHQIIQNLKKW